MNSTAWHDWTDGSKEIRYRDAAAVLRVDSYATGRMLDLKVNRLAAMFESDEEISEFIATMVEVLNQGDSS